MHRSENALRAGKIFAGEKAAPGELEQLAEALKKEPNFELARRLLQIRFKESDVQSSQDLKQKTGAEWSLCTDKDPDLPLDSRLDDALRILRGIATLETTDNQEILGRAGAIHKRRWEDGVTGRPAPHLRIDCLQSVVPAHGSAHCAAAHGSFAIAG